MTQTLPAGVEIVGKITPSVQEVLTPEALQLLADMQRTFNARRKELLARRAERMAQFNAGVLPGFLPATEPVSYTHLTLPTRDLV